MTRPEVDYYRVLGVLDDAEGIVIKAAYRALAQRYHPDRWQGDAEQATRKMAMINVAIDVLSDPIKRAAYDARRDSRQFRPEPPEGEDANNAIDRDWELATKYMPNLRRVEWELRGMSRELAFTFRLKLLESKNFDDGGNIAALLERNYLSRYFGDHPDTQACAKELILEGRKDAAKELNEVVRVLGRADSNALRKIEDDFKTAAFYSRAEKHRIDTNSVPGSALYAIAAMEASERAARDMLAKAKYKAATRLEQEIGVAAQIENKSAASSAHIYVWIAAALVSLSLLALFSERFFSIFIK